MQKNVRQYTVLCMVLCVQNVITQLVEEPETDLRMFVQMLFAEYTGNCIIVDN